MTELSIEKSISPISSTAYSQPAVEEPNDELSQSDFIELLVAQLKNQDPTEPMDTSQFMEQLNQSSMINGLSELQDSFDSLAMKLTSDQSLQAAGLVGKSVLVTGGQGLLADGGTVSGQLNLERQASDVNINIYNRFGEQVKTLPLGGHDSGSLQFKWDGFADDGSVSPPGNYLVTAEALIDGNQQAIEVSLEERIDSISLNKSVDGSTAGTVLNLASGQSVTLNDVTQIK